MRVRLLALVVPVVLASCASVSRADAPPPGSTWTQATIAESDGTKLHADVLRPSNLSADAKTPVIVSVGPYFNHSGQTGPAGPIEGTPYDPTGPAGPSSRFFDFVEGAHLMERGYTFVMVDLRGFGGSSGCLDWGGPGEQADVKAAVQWAAAQPWSTGHVGMYGKSYDGVTGLMGVALRPAGLDAVVSQEPVYDMYRYLYSNRVRFENSFLTPALYTAIDATPGTIQDDPGYLINGADNTARPGCYAANYLDQQSDDHSSAYWKSRDLIAKAAGSTVPLFMTQGFIEDNTKPDGAYDFFNEVAGPKRAWLGMWDHVRGNDVDANGRLAMGRHGWFDEVMRFYDQYLKGIAPADPGSAGRGRVQRRHVDERGVVAAGRRVVADDVPAVRLVHRRRPEQRHGRGRLAQRPGHLEVLAAARARRAPRRRAARDGRRGVHAPDANLVADVYDVDSAGSATLISRGTYLLARSGQVSFDLYGDDWKLPAGHRVGVLLTSSNAEWWLHRPTLQPVAVSSASIALPWRSCTGGAAIEGGPSIKLDSYKADAPFTVAAGTIAAATDPSFALPAALGACS